MFAQVLALGGTLSGEHGIGLSKRDFMADVFSAETLDAMHAMAKRGETVEKYDQMIADGNKEGNAVVQAAIDGLVDQTKSIQRVVTALDLGKIELEGSDSLDNPNAVFK